MLFRSVENLGAAFKDLIKTYAQLAKDQREKKKTDEEVKREANGIAQTIRSIISPLVVRRSRLDLEEIPEYKEDLKQQKIKTVVPNDPILLEYNLGGLEELYLTTLEKISPEDKETAERYFRASRYEPTKYIVENLRKEFEEELKKKYEVELNLLVGRQQNISAFMRKLLVRRFESSMVAFKQSLNYKIGRASGRERVYVLV